jgi:putative multiple sugar transport system substrate-binding protein
MRKILFILTGIFILMAFTGCAGSESSSRKTVGIVMPTKDTERWNRDGKYLKDIFESEGYDVELRFSDNNTIQQINDVQVLIADDVDILIIAAVDGSTLFRALEDAVIKNIPVISYDRLIMNTDAVMCYVSFDNYSVGTIQGSHIVKELDPDNTDGPYNIEIIAGDPADNNAYYFYKGAMDAIKPYIDSGKFVVPSGKTSFEQTSTPLWSTDTAFKNMQNTLASYYSDGRRLDAVLCSNDYLALGAMQAVQSDYRGSNWPVITGQDGELAILKCIVDGTIDMTIYKDVRYEADVAVSVATAILEGREVNEALAGEFSVECVYDTNSYNNGNKYVPSYLLKPEVIERDNLDKLVEKGTFMWDEDHRYLILAP